MSELEKLITKGMVLYWNGCLFCLTDEQKVTEHLAVRGCGTTVDEAVAQATPPKTDLERYKEALLEISEGQGLQSAEWTSIKIARAALEDHPL